MKYLIIMENGNGYRCNCCRRTYTSTDEMEFESDEAAQKYAKEYNETYDKEEDGADSVITAIYPLNGGSIL